MRISVALCSYNGERFLPDQLASIRSQTRPPDELVVCDDTSSDGSAAVVRAFASTVPFPVRLVVNPANLGTTRNFDQAIGLCTGDVVALADQDDVWLPHKLAALEAAIEANPDAGFAFGDADLTDERLTPFGRTLWGSLPFRRRDRDLFRDGRAFEVLLRRNYVTGATTAFRAAFRSLLQPIPPGWTHDAWIALVLSAVAPCVMVEEPLIRYRQHGGQQIGGKPRGFAEQYRTAQARTRESFEAVTERFAEARERLINWSCLGVGGMASLPPPSVGEVGEHSSPGGGVVELTPHPPLRGDLPHKGGGEDPAGAGVLPLAIPPDRLWLLDAKIDHARRRAALRTPGTWRLPRVLREAWRGNYARFSCGWRCAAQDLFLP